MADHPKRSFAPRFSLRTLLLVMLLLGPLAAVGWKEWQAWREREIQRAAELKLQRQEELDRKFAEVVAAMNNMSGGTALKSQNEENRSDESFPQSDPQ